MKWLNAVERRLSGVSSWNVPYSISESFLDVPRVFDMNYELIPPTEDFFSHQWYDRLGRVS